MNECYIFFALGFFIGIALEKKLRGRLTKKIILLLFKLLEKLNK